MLRSNLSPGFATKNIIATSALCLLIGIAVTRIHLRVQYTLTGYNLGQLKNQEQQLLEERSFLKMQVAKLTTKKHLQVMTKMNEKLPKSDSLAHNL